MLIMRNVHLISVQSWTYLFLFLFFCRYVVWIILLNVNAAKKDLFFTCLKRKETQNVSFAISLYVISIQHAWNTLPSPILPFGLVFKL